MGMALAVGDGRGELAGEGCDVAVGDGGTGAEVAVGDGAEA